MISISLCITCMGRRHQLEQTLPFSLQQAPDDDVEFVLLDYNSPDGLSPWIKQTFSRELASGKLKLVRTEKPKYFSMAHAKNAAHRHGLGQILVNLDADNFATAEYLADVRRVMAEGADVHAFHNQDQGAWGGGCGRVAIRWDWFYRLGGYDEQFEGWGGDDVDLVVRAEHLGARVHYAPSRLLKLIRHGDALRTENFAEAFRDKALTRSRIDAIHRKKLQAGELVANMGRLWGKL